VALLEFLLAAARARVIAPDVLQRIAHRVMTMIAVRAMNMPVAMIMMIVVVIAVGTMYMSFVVHRVATPE
jgi:hypothetical protein